MKSGSIRSLYISYFGLREPLVQTQVLPYLRGLSESGVAVWLMTFEPELKRSWNAVEITRSREQLASQGIRWSCLPYHKRPTLPATLFDIARGTASASRLIRRERIGLLHARGYVPAAMAALAKRIAGGRMIFDVRGFMPEEYVDAGLWPENGLLYRLTKRAERALIKTSDGFVVLTERARAIFKTSRNAASKPIEVIPCCVDFDRFDAANIISREAIRSELGIGDDRKVLIYVGALGGWYLTNEMTSFIAAAYKRDHRTYTLIVTQSEPSMISGPLKQAGVSPRDFSVTKAAPDRVPLYLKASDIALSFIKTCYSKVASSPTKIAEYLASGLPVLSNAGIGDLDELIEANRVGVILRGFSNDAYAEALDRVDALRSESDCGARCRKTARRCFDLDSVGTMRYRKLYDAVALKQRTQAASCEAAL